jgi:hypothetical protein
VQLAVTVAVTLSEELAVPASADEGQASAAAARAQRQILLVMFPVLLRGPRTGCADRSAPRIFAKRLIESRLVLR